MDGHREPRDAQAERVVVADDDAASRRLITAALGSWGLEFACARDGAEAWALLQEGGGPRLAVLDWVMPGAEGPELCRRIRESPTLGASYVILLTARSTKDAVVAGLEAGADDYLVKPFDRQELGARIRVGTRVLGLQARLARRITELQGALRAVRTLEGLLPICAYCKRIRADADYWQQVEDYVAEHSGAQFTHGICPCCLEREFTEEAS